MGVYFRGGAVYGYKINMDNIPEIEGVDPYYGEQAYDIASTYGVKVADEGDNMGDSTPNEVVFYDEGNYFCGQQTFDEQYGFFKIGGTEPSEALQELADKYDGEWGTFAFFTVW